MRQALEAAERALVSLGACDDVGCKEPNCEHALVLVRAALGNGGAMSESKIREAARRVSWEHARFGLVSSRAVQSLEAALDAPEEEVPPPLAFTEEAARWEITPGCVCGYCAGFSWLRSRFPAAFEEAPR